MNGIRLPKCESCILFRRSKSVEASHKRGADAGECRFFPPATFESEGGIASSPQCTDAAYGCAQHIDYEGVRWLDKIASEREG